MTKKVQIFWEKWENAVDCEEEQHDWEDDENEEGELGELGELGEMRLPQLLHLTRLGPMPVPTFNPESFNFWLAHTNFSITKPIINMLDHVDGVESIDVYTKHRMRVGIGKVFNVGSVFKSVETAVSGYLIND